MVFIFPTEDEAARFRAAAPDANISVCGVGLAEAAANISAIIGRCSDDELLVLCGVAGSYSPDIVEVGAVVEVVEESIEELPSKFARSYRTEPQTSLPSVKSNSVSGVSPISSCADVENMEGASFMALCAAHSRRGVQIRAISNIVGEPFEAWRLSEALDNLTKYLLDLNIK